RWSNLPGDSTRLEGCFSLIPRLTWQMYASSVKELVHRSPFTVQQTLVLGKKTTKLFVLDGNTGEVHRCFKSASLLAILLLTDGRETEIVDEAPCEIPEDPIFIGRVDYEVKSLDILTQREHWQVTLGEFTVCVSMPLHLFSLRLR